MQKPATTPRKVRSEKLQHPELPNTKSPLFDIALYLRTEAERAALMQARDTEFKKARGNDVLAFALTGAIIDLEDESNRTMDRIMAKGLLPLAWLGTNAMNICSGVPA